MRGSNELPKLVSVSTAAEMAGVSRSMAYCWARSGNLPGLVEINGRMYVRRAVLEAWLAGADFSLKNSDATGETVASSTEVRDGAARPSL
jgi:hypothetical protein